MPFDHLHPFCPPSPLLLATTTLFCVSMSWVFFKILHKGEITQYSSFSAWRYVYPDTLEIHQVVTNGRTSFRLWLNNIPLYACVYDIYICMCMDVYVDIHVCGCMYTTFSLSIHPLKTLQLFLCLVYHKLCCNERGGIDISLRWWCHFLQIYVQ